MSDEVKKAPSEELDDELSELLDSALEDFKTVPETLQKSDAAKQPKEPKSVANTANSSTTNTSKPPGDSKSLEASKPPVESEEWTEDFMRQAAAQFESNLTTLLGSNSDGSALTPDQIQAKFMEMAGAAQQVIEQPQISENSSNFAATISQTVQGLNEGSANLQSPFTDADIASIFGGQGQPDQNSFLPFMQGMMQSLLSKEVLYPSLKDILDKFPDWLDQNRGKITQQEFERYESQRKLMQDVCNELEGEQDTDGVEVKQQRFDRVLSLMQKLQDYGQPPTDLVGDVGGPGLPDFGADPSQCALM